MLILWVVLLHVYDQRTDTLDRPANKSDIMLNQQLPKELLKSIIRKYTHLLKIILIF